MYGYSTLDEQEWIWDDELGASWSLYGFPFKFYTPLL